MSERPVPTALVDRGLDWSDVDEWELDKLDPETFWFWSVSSHGGSIFVELGGFDGRTRELPVGRLDTA